VKYKDDERDLVTISSDIELQEALRLSHDNKILYLQLEDEFKESGCCFKRFFGCDKKNQRGNKSDCFLSTVCCPSSFSSNCSKEREQEQEQEEQTHCKVPSSDCPNPCGRGRGKGRGGCHKILPIFGVILLLLFVFGRCCVVPLLIGGGIALGVRSIKRYSRCHKNQQHRRNNAHPSCGRSFRHHLSKNEDKNVKKEKEEQEGEEGEVKIEQTDTQNNTGDSKILKFEQSLKLLEEMGFTNRQKNIEALISAKGKLVEAVQVLSNN